MGYLLAFIAALFVFYLVLWLTVLAVMWLLIPAMLIVLPIGLLAGVFWGCTVPLLTLTGFRGWRPRTITARDVQQGTSNLPKLRQDDPFGRDPAWPGYLVAQSRVDLREMWRQTLRVLELGWHKCRKIGDQWDNPVGWVVVVIGLCPIWLMVSVGALGAIVAILLLCLSALLVGLTGWLLVAGLLRGGDFLVRRLRRASGSCQSCYYVSSLPAFPCARCGEMHRDIRPGLLGAVWRRCICGALLPTTVLRAAIQLQTSCPNCLEPLRSGAAVHRDIRLPVFGPVSAGKTRLVYAGLLALRDQAMAAGASVDFVDDQSKRAFEHGVEIISTGSDTAKTLPGQLPTAVTAQLTVARRKALLHLFDAAGEFYIDRGDNSELLFLDHAQGLVFVVDPFSIPWVLDQLGGLGQVMLARANAAVDDPEEVYHVTAGRLRDYGVRTSSQRLAIAVVKADLLVDLPPAQDLRPHRVREWLQEAGLDNLVLAAERDFAEVRYFMVASVHSARAGSPMSPANPFAWLLARAGLQLLPGELDPTKQAEEAA
ncbi:MAG: TRAFAC clade GTPase domain-containing protein [Pseudonocardiaceae bacterium]